jgi:hypothetical protein
VIEEVVTSTVRDMLGERIVAVVATVSGGDGKLRYSAARCIHSEPRIDGFALGTVRYGIPDCQGIRRGGKPELDIIPLALE